MNNPGVSPRENDMLDAMKYALGGITHNPPPRRTIHVTITGTMRQFEKTKARFWLKDQTPFDTMSLLTSTPIQFHHNRRPWYYFWKQPATLAYVMTDVVGPGASLA